MYKGEGSTSNNYEDNVIMHLNNDIVARIQMPLLCCLYRQMDRNNSKYHSQQASDSLAPPSSKCKPDFIHFPIL